MKAIAAGLLSFVLLVPAARADRQREFVMSCTYGATAGTLVGAATLAFVKRPGDHLNYVARGASIGLYAGILLGAYVTLIIPRLSSGGDEAVAATRLLVTPILAEGPRGPVLDGAQADVRVLSF